MLNRTQSPTSSLELKRKWQQLRQSNPKLRARDAARALGVTEAELVASECGGSVVRLEADWGTLLGELSALGRVMALTRNEEAVSERKGRYHPVEIFREPDRPVMGQVLDEGIDLRLFLSHWHSGFAINDGSRRSLQFFDRDGTAIHKIFLTEESDRAAFAEVVARYRSEDQSPVQIVSPPIASPPERSDDEIDVEGLRRAWSQMRDTHEFFRLTRDFGVTRLQALRLAGSDWAQRVSIGSFPRLLQEAAQQRTAIMIFVGNPGVIQIHSGPIENVRIVNHWVNVLDPDFNLHVRGDLIASCWIVRKPTADGIVTSMELYNARGEQILLAFSKRKPGREESADWRELLTRVSR
ncbi:MAG: hemin-degrading factor [Pyrinomonas sp.]|uniref:hemin-degrading factor n=1 Tax=Pyrinomonas sp. TaxID=2080306 RepID=UPI003318A18A